MRPCVFVTAALYDPASGRLELDSSRFSLKFLPADHEPSAENIVHEIENVLVRAYEAHDFEPDDRCTILCVLSDGHDGPCKVAP